MRSELDRAALNERARIVVAVLLRITILKGRTSVVLPDREDMCRMLDIAKQHMAGIWREIETARIAVFKRVNHGWLVVLNADSSQWAVEWAWSRESWTAFAELIEHVPGQSQGSLFEPDPSIVKAWAEIAAEEVSNQNSYSKPPVVTKMVTPNLDERKYSVPAVPAVPVTCSPVKQALIKAGKTGEQVQVQVPVKGEAELMARLGRFFETSPHAKDRIDMAHWSGYWRTKVVRADKEHCEMCLKILEDEVKHGNEARVSRVAWLKDLLQRCASSPNVRASPSEEAKKTANHSQTHEAGNMCATRKAQSGEWSDGELRHVELK